MSGSTARRSALHRIFSIRSLVKSAAAVLMAVCIATAAASGTYALWNSSATVGSAATVRAGTAGLAITSPLAISATGMYPGLTRYGSMTIQNTGDLALAARVASLTGPATPSTFSQSLVVGVGVAATAAACTAGSVTPVWTGTFASASAATVVPSLAKGQSAILCVSIALPITAAQGGQGGTAPLSLTIDGVQS